VSNGASSENGKEPSASTKRAEFLDKFHHLRASQELCCKKLALLAYRRHFIVDSLTALSEAQALSSRKLDRWFESCLKHG
jgi:hypothetical protein